MALHTYGHQLIRHPHIHLFAAHSGLCPEHV
ncbi:hypothetical protein HWQ17_23600 (plasmid) [Enterobacter pasteurii]|nr:hypothetical protein HWQ17_23600 [Enterobacter pasteurii]